MSNRIEKVNSLLQHEISNLMLRDFNFSGILVTLTHVDTSPNLIECKAYVSVFPEENASKVLDVLNRGVYDIQQKINKMLNMRPIPKIIFVHDSKVAEASKVEALLERLKKEEK